MKIMKNRRLYRYRGTIMGGGTLLLIITTIICLCSFSDASCCWSDDFEDGLYWGEAKNGGSSFQAGASQGIVVDNYGSLLSIPSPEEIPPPEDNHAYKLKFSGGSSGTDYGNIWAYRCEDCQDTLVSFTIYYRVPTYTHDGNSYDRMKASLQFRIMYTDISLVTYSYVIAAWYQNYDYWAGSPGTNEKIIGGNPGASWHSLSRTQTSLQQDFPSIKLTDILEITWFMYLYGSGTNSDTLEIHYEDFTTA